MSIAIRIKLLKVLFFITPDAFQDKWDYGPYVERLLYNKMEEAKELFLAEIGKTDKEFKESTKHNLYPDSVGYSNAEKYLNYAIAQWGYFLEYKRPSLPFQQL